jgi:hypothetical protein
MADFTWRRGSPTLDAFGRSIPVSNFVRLNRDGSVIRTTWGVPYKPQPFPVGKWRIIGVCPQTAPDLAPFAILTDAWQMVEEWTLTPAGKYDRPSGHMVRDSHYWIHYSVLDFTFGCLRVLAEDDLRWLAGKTMEALAQIRTVTRETPWLTLDVLE